MDHQLPVSTICIATALEVHQKDRPQRVSAVITIRNPLCRLTAQESIVAEATRHPCETYKVCTKHAGVGGSVGALIYLR